MQNYRLLISLLLLHPAIAYCSDHASLVRPTELFQHSIEVKLASDSDYETISIAGPRLYSQFRTCEFEGQSSSIGTTPYNWYKIIGDQKSANRIVSSISDRKRYGKKIKLGRPSYLLTPATALGDAGTESGSKSANLMLAIEFLSRTAATSGLTTETKHFLCLPVMQRHHDEIYPIHSPACEYVLRKVKSKPLQGKINTIDQFGIHQAQFLSSMYTLESSLVR